MLLVSARHRTQSAVLPDNVRLEYVEQGEPTGLPVVLLHGVTDSWQSFSSVLSHLPNGLHAYAVSQRGHGRSSRPSAGYHLGDLAGDVASFLDAMQLPAAVIVGHSLGSLVAQRFAIDHPDRVRGLVLMGSTASLRANAGVRQFWRDAIQPLADPIDPAFVREFQQSTLARPVPAGFLDLIVQESLRVPARVWRDTFAGFINVDHTSALALITAPTLIVSGGADAYFSPEEAEALYHGIPDARLITYEAGGHGFHWEEPFRFAADLARFCKSLLQ